jgi:hypothetical protein
MQTGLERVHKCYFIDFSKKVVAQKLPFLEPKKS